MLVELSINLIVAALLITTIAWCWTLNRRIRVLQDSRTELAELLRHFDASTRRASDSIIALQSASKKIGETIQTRIEKANYVADDLAFLIERGNKMAGDMETAARKPAPIEDAAQAKLAIERARAHVEAEQPKRPPVLDSRQAPPAPASPPLASVQHMLEKLAARANDPATRGKRSAQPSRASQQNELRSRVEQELLDVIKASTKA